MKPSSARRTLSFVGIAVLLSACEVGPSALPSFTPSGDLTTIVQPSPPVAPAPVTTTQNYSRIETFRSASPGYSTAAGRVNGLTPTSGKRNAAEPGAGQAPGNKNRLVDDTRSAVNSGGSVTITVTGHTDSQHSNTNNAILSMDRAKTAANDLKSDLGLDAKVVGNASLCGAAPVCIVYRADPRAASNANIGRAASATATFSSPLGTNTGDDGGGGGNGSGGGSNPGEGTLSGGDWPISDVVPTPPSAPSFFEYYPGQDVIAENISIRVSVAIDDVFRTGGTIRPETVKVVSAEVFCGNTRCTGAAAPRLESFTGNWSISAAAASAAFRYPFCATSTSGSCAFFIMDRSERSIRFPGDAPRNTFVLGFASPTPAGVTVRPTIDVTSAEVVLRAPTWVGGAGCDAATPPERCWSFTDNAVFQAPISVVSTGGEVFTASGQSFYLPRRVIGSVGS